MLRARAHVRHAWQPVTGESPAPVLASCMAMKHARREATRAAPKVAATDLSLSSNHAGLSNARGHYVLRSPAGLERSHN